jgi:hypothetical protein
MNNFNSRTLMNARKQNKQSTKHKSLVFTSWSAYGRGEGWVRGRGVWVHANSPSHSYYFLIYSKSENKSIQTHTHTHTHTHTQRHTHYNYFCHHLPTRLALGGHTHTHTHIVTALLPSLTHTPGTWRCKWSTLQGMCQAAQPPTCHWTCHSAPIIKRKL